MCFKIKAWIKIVIGITSLFVLYTLTTSNEIDEIVPPSGGYRSLFALGLPIVMLIWGLIELVSNKPFSEVAAQWSTLKSSSKWLYSILIISFSIIVLFIVLPLLVFN